MQTIQVSDTTYRALELAARLTGMTPGGVIERLVAQSAQEPTAPAVASNPEGVAVYADYNGERIKGVFDPVTTRIDITSGRVAGTKYKTPSAAARAVVESERPGVDSNRNGWTFWSLDDGSGRQLQAIRQSAHGELRT